MSLETVLDMTMPKQALAEMRRFTPEVKLLTVSGFTESPASGSFAPGPGYLPAKPYKPEELKCFLRDLFCEAPTCG